MLLVALTGGIATGKSVASQVFAELGCYVFHADKAAHDLMLPHSQVWAKIVDRFGDNILNPDSTIDRSRLGKQVFSRPKDRIFLNELIHPLVYEQKKAAVARLRESGQHKIFISEAALTIEAGYIHEFDKVVITTCDPTIQIQRLMERDNITEPEALQKIQSQMDLLEKEKYADYVIQTSGTMLSTVEQTEQVFRYLLQDYQLLCGGSG